MPDHEESDAPLLALRRRRAVLGDPPPRLHGPRLPGRQPYQRPRHGQPLLPALAIQGGNMKPDIIF